MTAEVPVVEDSIIEEVSDAIKRIHEVHESNGVMDKIDDGMQTRHDERNNNIHDVCKTIIVDGPHVVLIRQEKDCQFHIHCQHE